MDFWLQRTLREIDSAIADLSVEQMSWYPAEGKWSISQILEHLSLTFSTTCTVLHRVLDGNRPTATAGTFVKWLSTRVVTDLGYFPKGRPAPAFAMPKKTAPGQIADEIRTNLIEMDALLSDAERRFGTNVKLADHPVLGPFTVTEWRKFHFRHSHHHAKQVLRLRQQQVSEKRSAASG